jgi:hypothetical protein
MRTRPDDHAGGWDVFRASRPPCAEDSVEDAERLELLGALCVEPRGILETSSESNLGTQVLRERVLKERGEVVVFSVPGIPEELALQPRPRLLNPASAVLTGTPWASVAHSMVEPVAHIPTTAATSAGSGFGRAIIASARLCGLVQAQDRPVPPSRLPWPRSGRVWPPDPPASIWHTTRRRRAGRQAARAPGAGQQRTLAAAPVLSMSSSTAISAPCVEPPTASSQCHATPSRR